MTILVASLFPHPGLHLFVISILTPFPICPNTIPTFINAGAIFRAIILARTQGAVARLFGIQVTKDGYGYVCIKRVFVSEKAHCLVAWEFGTGVFVRDGKGESECDLSV